MTSRLTLLATSAALFATLSACAPSMGMETRPPSPPMSPVAPLGMTARPDADMQAVLDAHAALGARPIESLTVAQARSQPSPADAVNRVKTMMGMPTGPDASVTTTNLTYPTGGATQPVRVYKPAGATGVDLPVVVYYHGGGWVIADLDVYDATPRAMAKALNAIVVSVEYRKGPEHRFPAFYEDASNAWKWVQENARAWGGDPMNIAVVGESAGGNLALNVAIAARDGGWTQPKAILAVYPIADSNPQLPSKLENTASLPLRTPTLGWFGQYALRSPADQTDARYNLVAANLRGLGPVTIVNAQIDPLRSDGETLMTALRAAGVPVERGLGRRRSRVLLHGGCGGRRPGGPDLVVWPPENGAALVTLRHRPGIIRGGFPQSLPARHRELSHENGGFGRGRERGPAQPAAWAWV